MTAIRHNLALPVFTSSGAGVWSRFRRGERHASRLVPRLIAATLILACALPSVGGAPGAEAGKKAKIVTRTFSSTGQIDMANSGPATPYGAPIKVKAFKKYKKAKITDVNVTLRDFSHDRPDDVDVMLVFGNRRAFILGDAGGNTGVDNLTLTLDDQAAAEPPNGNQLESAAYIPADHPGLDNFSAPAPLPNGNSALSVFKGDDPDGTWRLFVVDDAGTMTGEIAGGWKLEITAKVKKDKDKGKKKGKK
jgi:hypothetical protein